MAKSRNQHVDRSYKEQIEAIKADNLPQLLFRAARLLNDYALTHARVQFGAPNLRATHTALFPHIDLDGTRLVDLADRLGVTKQAASQWVDELEEMGVLERKRDPSDGRAKLIYFSTRGRASLLEGLALLGRIETDLTTEALGSRTVTTMKRGLNELLEWLAQRADDAES